MPLLVCSFRDTIHLPLSHFVSSPRKTQISFAPSARKTQISFGMTLWYQGYASRTIETSQLKNPRLWIAAPRETPTCAKIFKEALGVISYVYADEQEKKANRYPHEGANNIASFGVWFHKSASQEVALGLVIELPPPRTNPVRQFIARTGR